MSFSFYKVLWMILHLLADLIEAIYYFGLEFREKLVSFIKNISQTNTTADCKDENLLIERHIHEIKKHPKHIAVILNAKSKRDLDLHQLTNLVQWALSSGVNFISFYDYKGKKSIQTCNNVQRFEAKRCCLSENFRLEITDPSHMMEKILFNW